MKIANKILLTCVSILLVIFFTTIIFSSFIGDSNLNIVSKIKSNFSKETKMFLKKNIFVHKYNSLLLSEKRELKLKLFDKNTLISELIKKQESLEFKKIQEVKRFTINGSEYLLNRYKSEYLTRSYPYGKKSQSSSFIETLGDDIWLVTADGTIMFFTPSMLTKNQFNAKIVKSNLEKILVDKKIYKDKSEFGIKDILINNNKIYVSFTHELKKNCYNISIIQGEVNKSSINFGNFYKPDKCVNEKNNYGEFHAIQSGGRMKFIDENNLLLTTGEFRYRTLAQKDDQIFGKVLKINTIDKSVNIIAKGLRNSQGLFLDKLNNLIFLTDHGPAGGDEINVVDLNTNKVENFGWPISSYGEHYHSKKNSKRYIEAPLHKSHSQYGFKEPIKYFKKSIGISEIVKVNNNFFEKQDDDIRLLVSALGDNITEGDMSLHFFIFDKDFKIKKHEIIVINDRIRDLKYLKKEKKIILFLENAELAILNKV